MVYFDTMMGCRSSIFWMLMALGVWGGQEETCAAGPVTAHRTPSGVPKPLLRPIPIPPLRIQIDPVVMMDSATCVLPFTKAGNLILIKAKADTAQGYFVLDTGTPNLVLNITYFRRYPTTNPIESGGVTGAVTGAAQTKVDSLFFGSVKYFRLDADLINLGHIENSKGVKIFGLLGMKLFEQFEMIIDYDQSLIYLHLIHHREAATYQSQWLTDTLRYRTIPIDIEQDKIIAHLTLKGKKLKFIVDSGAETSVLDSRLQ